jgi:outer membrane protein insertion porin family
VRLFYEEVRELGFSARRKGLLLESTGFTWRGWDITGRYQFKWIDLFDEQPGVFISRFERDVKLSLLSAVLTRDRRDDILDPSRGNLANVIVQLSPSVIGSEADFVKSQFQYFDYRPLPAGAVFASGLRIGLAWPLAGSDEIPLSERFFFNGLTTLRGFELSELNPEGGEPEFAIEGHALLIGNAELRFPLFREFGGVFFYDLGAAYPYVGDINLSDLVHAAGLGLRYRTPLGPLRFDYSWSLRGDDRTAIFSFGHAF